MNSLKVKEVKLKVLFNVYKEGVELLTVFRIPHLLGRSTS